MNRKIENNMGISSEMKRSCNYDGQQIDKKVRVSQCNSVAEFALFCERNAAHFLYLKSELPFGLQSGSLHLSDVKISLQHFNSLLIIEATYSLDSVKN